MVGGGKWRREGRGWVEALGAGSAASGLRSGRWICKRVIESFEEVKAAFEPKPAKKAA
jgi:hypothetical protein